MARVSMGPVARAGKGEGEHSVSVRKIDNGYITRHVHSDEKGFSSKERFSEDPPEMPSMEASEEKSAPMTGAKALREAIEHASKGRKERREE